MVDVPQTFDLYLSICNETEAKPHILIENAFKRTINASKESALDEFIKYIDA